VQKLAELIEMRFGGCLALAQPPKEPCGQHFGVSGPVKSIGSLCCGVRSKRDHSVLNNGRTCDAAFRQNYLTTCPLWFRMDRTAPSETCHLVVRTCPLCMCFLPCARDKTENSLFSPHLT